MQIVESAEFLKNKKQYWQKLNTMVYCDREQTAITLEKIAWEQTIGFRNGSDRTDLPRAAYDELKQTEQSFYYLTSS